MSLTPELLCERLLRCGAASAEQIVGCTDEDIAHIEQVLGLPLPAAYESFLRTIGRAAGEFMHDIDYHYPDLLDFRREAEEILADNEEGALFLPADAIVQSIRQGEDFIFFTTSQRDADPPVMHYFENTHHFRNTAKLLWEIVEEELIMTEAAMREAGRWIRLY